MTGSYTNNGDGTATVKFEYIGDLQKAANIIDRAAYYLFMSSRLPDEDPGNFDDLTNQEKIDLVDNYVRLQIRNLSRSQLSNDYDQAAQEDFENDWESNYDLGLGG